MSQRPATVRGFWRAGLWCGNDNMVRIVTVAADVGSAPPTLSAPTPTGMVPATGGFATLGVGADRDAALSNANVIANPP